MSLGRSPSTVAGEDRSHWMSRGETGGSACGPFGLRNREVLEMAGKEVAMDRFEE